MQNTDRLGKAPLGKLLFSLCGQSGAALLLYSIYSFTDTLFIARGTGDDAAAAVALTSPILLILGAVNTTVGSGGASVISRALGRKDTEKAARAAANVFITFWLAAIATTTLGLVLLEPLLTLLGATSDTWQYARDYSTVILAGAITSTAFSSLIRAEGNAKFAMYLWLLPVLVNILLDAAFIFLVKWGTFGAALATVSAQCISCLMSLWFFFFKPNRDYKINLRHFRPHFELMREIVLVGIPSFFQQITTSISTIVLNRMLAALGGANAIAGFGYASRIHILLVIPFSGIAQGAQPVIGYNYECGSKMRVRQTVRICLFMGVLYGVLCSIPGILLRSNLVSIFTVQEPSFSFSTAALTALLVTMPVHGITPMIATFCQATGKAALALLLSVQILLFRLPLMCILGNAFGINGLFATFPVSEMMAVLFTVITVILNNSQRHNGRKQNGE